MLTRGELLTGLSGRLHGAGLCVLVAGLSTGACHRPLSTGESTQTDAAASDASMGASPAGSGARAVKPAPGGPVLAATSLDVEVYARPDASSKRLGYLRLGAVVGRDAKPVSTAGCPGGWYRVDPWGYVCVGDDATLDPNAPLVRASSRRPDLTRPMPYRYAFVRAVAPLYLRVPTAAEQLTAEFKLKDHLDWWGKNSDEASRVLPGSNDVPLDAVGAPLVPHSKDAGAVAGGDARGAPPLSLGELLGGDGPNDPVPFWLSGGRTIPNVSGFKVPAYAYFANRVRRHTGLALVGSFATGPESLERRFGVTVDLRLVPASKIKPDNASPFHGVAIGGDVELPIAFVRTECGGGGDAGGGRKGGEAAGRKSDRPRDCAHSWRVTETEATEESRTLPWRKLIRLSGKSRRVGGALYREGRDGSWLKASDLAVVSTPSEWPPAAGAGQKWIDVSIENQTLTAWEGQRAVYATLVSTGQDGLKDPKTTKSTIQGTFRIQNKQVTATMDSNERSGQAEAASSGRDETSDRPSAGSPSKGTGASARPGDSEGRALRAKVEPGGGEGSEPGSPRRRRGEGTFELRDVPYVQYFKSGYALHAAYWHDVFGKARSHGCINLSPIDAHYLFAWTEPKVPDGWHGIYTGSSETGEGTVITVHK